MLTSGVILAGLVISTSSPATAVTSVKLGKATRAVKGCDVRRTPDSLVIYTRAWGSSTRTNRHGFEAAVVGGKVIRVADRRGNMRIPRRGVVLSGNGTSRRWLRKNAWVGRRAVIPRCPRRTPVASPSATPTPTPSPTATPSPTPTPTPTPPPAPTALLPDLGMRGVTEVSLDTTSTPGTKKLRFTAIVVNAGAGRLEVTGERTDTTSDMTTVQRIFYSDGSSTTRDTPARMYFAGDGHSHWHVRDFASYDLVITSTGSRVGTQAKHGFCFWDTYRFTSPDPAFYTTCGKNPAVSTQNMGISPGWGDKYPAKLTSQYIDVTGLQPGTYRMRLTADADNWFSESNENNNGNWADIAITPSSASVVASGGDLF